MAELVLFMRETVRELGERRASGFLKKFYGWYLGRGRFPSRSSRSSSSSRRRRRSARLFAAAPGAPLLERLEPELPGEDEVLLDAADLGLRRRMT